MPSKIYATEKYEFRMNDQTLSTIVFPSDNPCRFVMKSESTTTDTRTITTIFLVLLFSLVQYFRYAIFYGSKYFVLSSFFVCASVFFCP